MTQSHCLLIPGLTELRSGLDMAVMADMVTFYRKLLKETIKQEKKGPDWIANS